MGRGRDGAGFTLLEVLVAMTLFAAGAVLLARLFSGALRLSSGARDASAASIYASQRMEEALLSPDPAEGVERGAFGEGYRWELATVVVPREGEAPYDEVRFRVTVTWDDGGRERSTGLESTRWRRRGNDGGG